MFLKWILILQILIIGKINNMIKKETKCVFVNIYLKRDRTEDEQERYNAALMVISKELFYKNYGEYGGRETCLQSEDNSFDYKYPFTTYFYIFHEDIDITIQYIVSVFKNFRLNKFAKVKTGVIIDTSTISKKQLSSRKELTWTWTR